MPTNGKPAASCRQGGDRAYYCFGHVAETPWICHSCHPPGYMGWRMVWCRHVLQCDPPEYVRSTIFRWFVVPGRRP